MKWMVKGNFPKQAIAITPHNTNFLSGWPKTYGVVWIASTAGGTVFEGEDAAGNAVVAVVAAGDVIPVICSRVTTDTTATCYLLTNYDQ